MAPSCVESTPSSFYIMTWYIVESLEFSLEKWVIDRSRSLKYFCPSMYVFSTIYIQIWHSKQDLLMKLTTDWFHIILLIWLSTKVSFFHQWCSKMQLIPLKKIIIQTCFFQFLWFFRLKCWFKGQIISRIHLSLPNAYKLMSFDRN